MINGLSLTPPTSRGLYCNCLPSCGDGLRRSGARLRFLCDYRHISDGVVRRHDLYVAVKCGQVVGV